MMTLTAENAPGFNQPLEMLRACHGKMIGQCNTLQKLCAHLHSQGCDIQAQQAAIAILRYFDTAGQFHHQDEEQDLFPALYAAAGMNTALLDRLLSDHRIIAQAWDALRPALLQLAERQPTNIPPDSAERFIAAYTSHITTENTELLPLAACLLNSQQLQLIGQNMAKRRGITEPE